MHINHLKIALYICSILLVLPYTFCTLDYFDEDDLNVEEIYNSFVK